MGNIESPEFWENIRRIVRRRMRTRSDLKALRRDDHDDLEATLIMRVLQRIDLFDAKRANLATFVYRIVDGGIASHFAAENAQKRIPRAKTVAIDRAYCGDRYELHPPPCETYSNETYREAIQGTDADAAKEEDEERRLRVARAMEELAPKLRILAEALLTMSPSEAARYLGVPRTTLTYRQSQIRRVFAEFGLENFS